MHRNLLAVLLLAGFALPAAAVELTGSDIIIPIVGRAAGMHGTFWKSDVYVTNINGDDTPVRFDFMSGGTVRSHEVWLGPAETYVVHDYVLTKHRRESGAGLLRVSARREGIRLAARAWVYSTDAEGREVGQNVQGIATASLMRDAHLFGLEVSAAARTNVGVANPHDVDAEVWLVTHERTFRQRARIVVPARSVVQLNLAELHRPGALGLEIRSRLPVLPYASVIRNSSGDPQFVLPAELRLHPDAEPACLDASPLWAGTSESRWSVWLREKTNVRATMAELAAKYGFAIERTEQNVFLATLTSAQLAAMRCDSAIACLGCGWPSSGPVP